MRKLQQAGVASKEYEFGRWEWREPTLNQRRADSAVPATASLVGVTVLTKPELPVTASGHELGVVNSAVYAGGRRVADVAIEEAGEWSKRPGHVVWIGLVEPSDDLLQRVQRQFDLASTGH